MWNLFWFDVLTPPVFVAGSTRLGASHDIDFGASFLIAPRCAAIWMGHRRFRDLTLDYRC